MEQDPKLEVVLQDAGRTLTNISSYSIDSSFTTSTDGFEFVAYDPDRSKLQSLELEPVELLLNGNSQVLGRIDQTEIGGNGSAVTFRGRDFMSDLVECNVDPTLKITSGMPLFQAILLACRPCGINIVVDDEGTSMREIRTGKPVRGGKPDSLKPLTLEDLKPKPGEGIYEFVNRFVARFGGTIQPGLDRHTIVVAKPNYKQEPLYELRRTDAANDSLSNNVMDATVRRDYSSFPTYTLFNGKEGASGATKKDLAKSYDMSVLASAFNDEMGETLSRHAASGRRKPDFNEELPPAKLYRLLYLRDEDSRTAEQMERAARRAISERLKNALSYRATLRGHQDPRSGALWGIDTMVRVNDAILGVNETLWIESRKFMFSPENGATTEIECWRPSSFEI